MSWGFFTGTGKEKLTEEERNPAGMIVQWPSTTPPGGWLLCDGSEKLISAYPDLYTAIGTTYGALTNGSGSNGTTHMRLPAMNGRIPVGMHQGAADGLYDEQGYSVVGACRSGTGAPSSQPANTGQSSLAANLTTASRALGYWRGEETIVLTAAQTGIPTHGHTLTDSGTHYHNVSQSGNHNHIYYYPGVNYVGGTNQFVSGASTFGPFFYDTSNAACGASIPAGTTGVTLSNTVSTTASGTHNNLQPSLAVAFIIKT